jgi:Double zinc ribbon
MQSTDCPYCDHANPAGAKFCNECGSPLHLAPCRHCDAVNHVDDEQCYRCGASLAPHTVAANGDTGEAQPVGLDQQARWVEQELLRLGEGLSPTMQASGPGDAEQAADEPGPEAIEGDLGAVNPASSEDAPGWRDPVGPDSLACASVFAAGERSTSQLRPSRGSGLPEARRLFSEVVERPSSRWPEYLGGVFALVVVLGLIAGGYWYYSRNLASRPAESEATMRAPVYPEGRVDEATVTPRPARTSLAPQAKAVDARQFDTIPSTPPAESRPAARGADAPAETAREKDDTAVVSRPDSSAKAAAEPKCPPAVAAMALCDWVARADRN